MGGNLRYQGKRRCLILPRSTPLTLLHSQKDGPNLAKSKIYIGSVAPVAGQTGITMAGAEDHARQRRAMAHPFSNTALLQQEEIIQTHIDKLMTKLKTQAEEKQSIDISSWCRSIQSVPESSDERAYY